jgi:hypothetical protein
VTFLGWRIPTKGPRRISVRRNAISPQFGQATLMLNNYLGTGGLPKFGWLRMLKNSARVVGETELAAQGDVPLRGAQAAEGIASELAFRGGRYRHGKRCGVDDLAPSFSVSATSVVVNAN